MLIYNAEIYTMDSMGTIPNGYISIENGKITDVGSGAPENIPEDSIDAEGGILCPGFIDAHTHLGIIENGLDFEGDDCNESTDPFSPQMRAIDGINPFDRCFEEARKRGITAAASCPGSANPCGGEICVIKTDGRRIDDMLISTCGIKFALGENPKKVYNDRAETPVTRMAVTALIREGLYKAKRYSHDMNSYYQDSENYDPPEYDIKCEALMPLLDRKIKAFFHCHRADDICTAIRIAKEFNLDPVIIHGTEGLWPLCGPRCPNVDAVTRSVTPSCHLAPLVGTFLPLPGKGRQALLLAATTRPPSSRPALPCPLAVLGRPPEPPLPALTYPPRLFRLWLLSGVRPCVTLWTGACQAPLSMRILQARTLE